MPPKGKDKKTGKKGEGAPSFDTKVSAYMVEVTQAQTACGLLESPEEQIVIMSLCALDNFISKYGRTALTYLQDLDLLLKLINNLPKHPSVRLLSLKLIVKLFGIESTLPKLQNNKQYMENLENCLMAAENLTEIEYISYILAHTCSEERCAELLIKEEIIEKLFKNIVTYPDEDIKFNCLKILLSIVNCYRHREKIASGKAFKIGVLHLIIEGPYPSLRPVTVEVIQCITEWEFPFFQKMLFDTDTIQYLFLVLCEEKWSDAHNNALSGIYNLLQYNPVQMKCLESRVFLKFVNIARKSSQEHALACMALIQQLLGSGENMQVMVDFGIHEQLADLCRFDDDLIFVKFCDVLCTFCQNCYLIPRLATHKVIQEIGKLMQKEELPWTPYRMSGIRPLHIFLMNNPKVGLIFYQTGVLKPLLEAILKRDELDEFNYKLVLQMFQSLVCSKALHKYLWNREIYVHFVEMLSDKNPDIIVIIIDVLQRSFYSQQYRQWFLENDGFETVLTLLCQRNCSYLDRVIALCKFAAKYEELCIALLRHGFIPILEHVGIGLAREKPICDSIVNDIYRCELSIKFFKRSVLDFEDIIKNGFCMYANFRPRNFPPVAVDEVDKLCYTCTMITINFHGQKRTKIPVAIAHQEAGESATSIDSGNYGESESCKSTKCIIYKKILPEAIGEPTTDYHLKNYLKKVKLLLDKDDSPGFTRKIGILANFVVACLSGFDKDLPTKHAYETHIVELKKKHRSNYIPLGSIRLGTMIERALLFKVLADRLGIPCTLRREGDCCLWNEVALYTKTSICESSSLPINQVQECIVDLMCDVGKLLPKGEHNTTMYCKNSAHYDHSEPCSLKYDPCDSGTNTSNTSLPNLPTFELYSDYENVDEVEDEETAFDEIYGAYEDLKSTVCSEKTYMVDETEKTGAINHAIHDVHVNSPADTYVSSTASDDVQDVNCETLLEFLANKLDDLS